MNEFILLLVAFSCVGVISLSYKFIKLKQQVQIIHAVSQDGFKNIAFNHANIVVQLNKIIKGLDEEKQRDIDQNRSRES